MEKEAIFEEVQESRDIELQSFKTQPRYFYYSIYYRVFVCDTSVCMY